MRLELTLVALLSCAVTAAADGPKTESSSGVRSKERDRESVRRRLKMGSGSSMSKKRGTNGRFRDGEDGDEHYYATTPMPPVPAHSDPPPPQPQPQPQPQPSPYGKGKGGREIYQKKQMEPRGFHDRNMNAKSAKSAKSKGMDFTPPPNPSPPPNGTPAPTSPDGCTSAIASSLATQIPQVFTRNPARCCNGNPPTAVFVTHGEPDDSTFSGFEPFWDAIFLEILQTTNAMRVCFVMTGFDAGAGASDVGQVLLDTIGLASTIPEVPSIMVTDPTTDVVLMQGIRGISRNTLLSSIGVFNAGYNNVVVESIVSGQDRLPYVGYLSDADYGTEAGRVSLRLLDGVPSVPLCYNARIGVISTVGERCAAFYAEVTSNTITPQEGVACSATSDPQALAAQIVAAGANTIWSHVDCCQVVSQAVELARAMGLSIIVGCQDLDTTGGDIDFVTQQPIQLQGYQAAAMASFPVIQAGKGQDGRGDQFFPSLQTLVNTGIFSDVLM